MTKTKLPTCVKTSAEKTLSSGSVTAHQMADAANCRTPDHDAVPAAIARTYADRNRTDKAALRPGEGTGNTPDAQPTPSEGRVPRDDTSVPVAFAVVCSDAIDSTFTDRDEAVEWACGLIPPAEVIPLYAVPQLYRVVRLPPLRGGSIPHPWAAAERQVCCDCMDAAGVKWEVE
jgi:hypothetical protein